MKTVRDCLWVWGHEAGSHNDRYELPGPSRMTPVEGAAYLGLPNLIMVVFDDLPRPPFDRHAVAMGSLDRVIWSIVGDSSSGRNDEETDLDEILRLSTRFPNILGAIMDDFFHGPDAQDERIARYTPEAVASFQDRLDAARLDLWVVVYDLILHQPLGQHLAHCDGLTYWTWEAENLDTLKPNFERLETMIPEKRKLLGCYLWNYGGKQRPFPRGAMEHQCELGLEWLKAGRIEGIVFLATCICDLEIETVEWTREWIASVGDTQL